MTLFNEWEKTKRRKNVNVMCLVHIEGIDPKTLHSLHLSTDSDKLQVYPPYTSLLWPASRGSTMNVLELAYERYGNQAPDSASFKRLFDPVVERLAAEWPAGCGEYIREHRPDLDAAEREARTATEQAWRGRDMSGFKKHLEEFRAAVNAEISAYHLWRQRNGQRGNEQRRERAGHQNRHGQALRDDKFTEKSNGCEHARHGATGYSRRPQQSVP